MQTGKFGPHGWFRQVDPSIDPAFIKFSWIEEEAIWSFLYEHIQHPNYQTPHKYLVNVNALKIWERFRVEKKSIRSPEQLRNHFVYVMAKRLSSADMPIQDKMDLYFGLDIPIDPQLHQKLLRAGSRVTLDPRGCIQYYVDPTGDIELRQQALHNFPERLSVGEEQFIWEWLLNNIEDKNTGQIIRGQTFRNQEHDWNKFVKETKFPISAKRCLQNFQFYMIPTLYAAPLHVVSKIKIMFALELKVPKEIEEELAPSDKIMMDHKGCIHKFSDKFGMRLNADDIITYGETRYENKGTPFTEKEDIIMLRYILSFSKDNENKTIKAVRHMFETADGWSQLVDSEYNTHSRNAQTYHKRFHNILIRNLDFIELDPTMKVALHCTLHVPASDRYIRELRKSVFVRTDTLGRIECIRNPRNEGNASERKPRLTDQSLAMKSES